jgi:pyruvate dehydrogenase E2 component (dihydrolipoamide acetyltransferase)
LTPAELGGATFTLTDSVAYDIATLTPLIVPPQAAALAAGPVRDVPVVRHGEVVPGHTMVVTLACDHRIVYGAHAAAFLEEIKAHLEEAT